MLINFCMTVKDFQIKMESGGKSRFTVLNEYASIKRKTLKHNLLIELDIIPLNSNF